MDKIINLKKINKSFQDIISNQGLTDIETKIFQDNIEKLDWYIKRFKIEGKGLIGERKPNIELLEDIGFYLFGYLTGSISSEFNQHISGFKKDGLNISALIFELFASYYNEEKDDPTYGTLTNKYLFYSSVCYSLSGKEANAIYIAKIIEDNILETDPLLLTISKTLQRDFKGIINNNSIKGILTEEGVESDIIKILYQNANNFIDGDRDINFFYSSVEQLSKIKIYLIDISEISLLFIVSRLEELLIEIINNSVWNILLPLGFSEEYILSLTKNSNKNIYELWEGQRNIINNIFDTNDNRFLINIPTSGGKTQIAELLMIRKLENDIGKKIIYIVPTNSLANQVEDGFFNRFRGLGYKIASNIDIGNDINDIKEDIIILTPEKLDLLVRKEPNLVNIIGLFVFDEFHKINESDRGLLLETLFSFLMIKQDSEELDFQIVTLSAIVNDLTMINKWFGNDNGLFQSTWEPTRKLFGILKRGYHVSKTEKETPFDLVFHYKNVKGNIDNLFKIKTKLYKNGRNKGEVMPPENSYKIYEFILKLYTGDNSPILIYFGNKNHLLSIIKEEKINKYGEQFKEIFNLEKNKFQILKLKNYLISRLSKEHPLTKIIGFGIAFHNGDLPKDVRVEIENAYKKGIIKVLLTTSTLADGVNLPIKNLIFHSLFGVDIGTFRNIIGRAGRAMEETEGNIFFINSDKGKIEQNKNEKLSINSGLNNIVIHTPGEDKKYVDFLDYVSGLEVEERDLKVKEFNRLQIFIYSIYEYLKNNDNEITLNDVKKQVSKGLYLINKSKEDQILFNTYYNYAYDKAEKIYNQSPFTLMVMNKTGLSDKSFWDMYEIGKIINFEPNEYINVLGIEILNPYPKVEELITEEIFEKLLMIDEFHKVITFNKFNELDNYNILFYWIKGSSLLEIRDKFFDYEKDIVKRTSMAVKYTTTMFEYILPWAFSSLSILCEGLKQSNTILREIKLLPLKVKHGVETEYGIDLVKIGIEYHELLVALEKLYLEEKNKFNDEMKELDFFDQEEFTDIGNWLLKKPFHSLEKESFLDNNTSFIRNIGKVKNKLKERSHILEINGKLKIMIKGIDNNEFKNYDLSKIDNKEKFSFIRDYNNIYDYFAVKILYGDGELGFVESENSEEISDYIKKGTNFEVLEIKNDGTNIEIIICIKVEF